MNTNLLGIFIRDERTIRALFGLGSEKLEELGRDIERLWRQRLEGRGGRQRAFGAGRKGKVPGGKEKAVFILFYMKVYPTFDVLSAVSGINRGECCRWVHKLLPLLEKALGQRLMLPKRKIDSMEGFYAAFPQAKEVCIDGMERPRQRPKKKAATASTSRGRRGNTRRRRS